MEDVWSVNHEEEDGEARRDVGVCDIVGVFTRHREQVDVWIGLDLGTTNTAAAVWHPGRMDVKVIRLASKSKYFPSSVRFPSDSNARPLVGIDALESEVRRRSACGKCWSASLQGLAVCAGWDAHPRVQASVRTKVDLHPLPIAHARLSKAAHLSSCAVWWDWSDSKTCSRSSSPQRSRSGSTSPATEEC
jgi:hypothetical protein